MPLTLSGGIYLIMQRKLQFHFQLVCLHRTRNKKWITLVRQIHTVDQPTALLETGSYHPLTYCYEKYYVSTGG